MGTSNWLITPSSVLSTTWYQSRKLLPELERKLKIMFIELAFKGIQPGTGLPHNDRTIGTGSLSHVDIYELEKFTDS